MMFDVGAGWLQYRPFSTYRLPELVRVEDEDEFGGEAIAKFRRKGVDGDAWTNPLYELRWPGYTNKAGIDSIPTKICDKWPGVPEALKSASPGGGGSYVSLEWLKEEGLLPDPLPDALAYHLAINEHHYGPIESPVAALPAQRVQEVMDAEFAVNEHYWAALQYLKWHAEGHNMHPLFRQFDSSVRDYLHEITQKSAQLYFYLLRDCMYDRETMWFKRGDSRLWWDNFATYLHWVGRTGTGLYDRFSFPLEEHRRKLMWDEIPDVASSLEEWLHGPMAETRANSHVNGKDPCSGEGIPVEDVSLE